MELNTDQYTTIMTTLTMLVEGNKGINEHLKTLNGKVAKHEEGINTLMLWKARASGIGDVVSVGWGLGVSLVAGCAATIFYWLTHR